VRTRWHAEKFPLRECRPPRSRRSIIRRERGGKGRGPPNRC
jgi:hypothetical protein